jgi:hypothetical protein
MGRPAKETLDESVSRRLRNNPVVAITLIAVGTIVGIGALTGALDDTWGFVEGRLLGRSVSVRNEYCELLVPLIIELDRTKAAFDRWNQKDLSLESETIRDGNLRARALLREKGHLVPSSLSADQRSFIFHYDRWLEEYDRVRIRRTTNPDADFVFVYSFPMDSEQRFRQRMEELRAMLGNDARCK